MTIRTYSSPEAFKQAARIVAVLGDTATLKGGLVLLSDFMTFEVGPAT
jgi:hypothetical protein